MSAPLSVFKIRGEISFHRVKYREQAAALRSSPGQWATIILAGSPNAAWCHAQAVKTGRRAAFRPAGSFQAVTRECEVIARYVGGEA